MKDIICLALVIEYFVIYEDFIALSRMWLNQEDGILWTLSNILLCLHVSLRVIWGTAGWSNAYTNKEVIFICTIINSLVAFWAAHHQNGWIDKCSYLFPTLFSYCWLYLHWNIFTIFCPFYDSAFLRPRFFPF